MANSRPYKSIIGKHVVFSLFKSFKKQEEPAKSGKGFTAFEAVVTARHLEALKNEKVFFSVKGGYKKTWLEKGHKIAFTKPVFCEANACFAIGPTFYSLGAHSYSKSCFPLVVPVGRYCAIGDDVTIIGANHPMERLSTSGLDYANYPFYPEGFKKVRPPHKSIMPLAIGNDVWIGQGATLARGIKIGDGAVIATKAIVTKDVPPYAIVAGTPAVVKKYRFNEKLVERLVASQWFNHDPADFNHLDTTDPERFLGEFEELKSQGKLRIYEPKKVALHKIFMPK